MRCEETARLGLNKCKRGAGEECGEGLGNSRASSQLGKE
jgi:hypothetical protein